MNEILFESNKELMKTIAEDEAKFYFSDLLYDFWKKTNNLSIGSPTYANDLQQLEDLYKNKTNEIEKELNSVDWNFYIIKYLTYDDCVDYLDYVMFRSKYRYSGKLIHDMFYDFYDLYFYETYDRYDFKSSGINFQAAFLECLNKYGFNYNSNDCRSEIELIVKQSTVNAKLKEINKDFKG